MRTIHSLDPRESDAVARGGGVLEFLSSEKALRDENLSIVRWHARCLGAYFDVEERVTPRLQAAIDQDAWIVDDHWFRLRTVTDPDDLEWLNEWFDEVLGPDPTAHPAPRAVTRRLDY